MNTWRKQVIAPIRRTNMLSIFSRRKATFSESISSESTDPFRMSETMEGLTMVARVTSTHCYGIRSSHSIIHRGAANSPWQEDKKSNREETEKFEKTISLASISKIEKRKRNEFPNLERGCCSKSLCMRREIENKFLKFSKFLNITNISFLILKNKK